MKNILYWSGLGPRPARNLSLCTQLHKNILHGCSFFLHTHVKSKNSEQEEDCGHWTSKNLLISSTARRTAWTCAQHRLKNPGPIKWTSPMATPPLPTTTSLTSSPSASPSSSSSSSFSSPPLTSATTQSSLASTYFHWFTEFKELPKKVTKPAFSQFSQLIATIEATDYHAATYDFQPSSSSPSRQSSTKKSSSSPTSNLWMTTEKSPSAPWETFYGPTTDPPWCVN